MNRFVFDVEIEMWADGSTNAKGSVNVYGVTLEAPGININELVDSLINPGKYWLFACGCGSPDCGYVIQRIAVTHKDGLVTWRFRSPIAFWKPAMPQTPWDERVAAWRKQSQQVRLTFDRRAMIDEVVEAIDWVLEEISEDLPEEHQWYFVYGISREELMTMRSDLLRCRGTLFLQ